MSKHESYSPIGTVLDTLLRSLGIERQIDQYKIFDAWNEVVGEQVAKVAKPERIRNGTLIVSVNNAPWRAELTFRKQEILDKIRDTMNSNSITDIIFR